MTADTSAVVAALSAWHESHDIAAEALSDVRSLPAHAMLEAYSVLTRLPAGLAVPAATAAEVLAGRFPIQLTLDESARSGVLARLAEAGVFGGSSYDGFVALEAAAHGEPLLTLDQRAGSAYARLGIDFRDLESGASAQ